MHIDGFNIAGITLSIFFSMLILSKKGKNISDKILVIWLFVIAYHFLSFFIELNHYKYYNILIEFSGALVFLHGPLILAYILSIHKKKHLPNYFYIHFAPSLINIALIPVLVKYDSYQLDIILAVFKTLSGIIYPLFIFRLLSGFNKQLVYYFSEVESRQLSWIKMVNIGILMLFIIGSTSLTLSELKIINITYIVDLVVVLFLFLYVGIIGFFGFKQGDIFLDLQTNINAHQKLNIEDGTKEEPKKYLKTGLSLTESKQVFINFQKTFEENNFYLDPEITLFKLAEKIDMPANKLSQIINQNTNKNFFEFINSYRVNNVISQLHSGKHHNLTLLSIGLSAGFNSKTSFNRTFKKYTNLTPSEYIKNLS